MAREYSHVRLYLKISADDLGLEKFRETDRDKIVNFNDVPIEFDFTGGVLQIHINECEAATDEKGNEIEQIIVIPFSEIKIAHVDKITERA